MEGLAAALDLGSNTFHLLIAEWGPSGWVPRLRQGEVVRLAEPDPAAYRALSTAAMERGWSCLERFSTELCSVDAVRIVATQAVRAAANRHCFVTRAEQILGRPVEVIDGCEEARLIWTGMDAPGASPERAAAHSYRLDGLSSERLVIDVGGGSTELIRGQAESITRLASVPVGCLSLRALFPEGRIDERALAAAYARAGSTIAAHWSGSATGAEVWGCSGTLLAIEQVLREIGHSAGGIDRAGLAVLRTELKRSGAIDGVRLPGLCDRRRPVFATGVILAAALFDVLDIEQMRLTSNALREGVMEQLWRDHWRPGLLRSNTMPQQVVARPV